MISKFLRSLSAVGFLVGSTLPLSAQTTVLNDSYTDGQLDGGADSNGGNWIAASASTATVVDDAGGLGTGNAMELLSTGTFSRLTTECG
jgi:hypothetical protein